MTFYVFSALINLCLSFLIGFFVLLKDHQRSVNRHFFYFCLAVAFWSFGYIFWQLSNNYLQAIFWLRVLMFGASFTPIFYFTLVYYFLHLNYNHLYQWLVNCGYILCLFFAFVSLFTNWIVLDAEPKMFFPFWPNGGILFLPFLGMFFGYIVLSSYLLAKEYFNAHGVLKNQIILMLIGIGVAFLGGSTNYLLWLDIKIPPLWSILVSSYPILIGYSIIRYRLFNIRLIIKRGSIFTLLVIITTTLYTLLTYLITVFFQNITDSNSVIITGLITSIFVALGFQPLKSFLQRSTDRFLFKGEYNVQELLAKLGDVLSSSLDLKQLGEYLSATLVKNFKTNGVILELIDKKTGDLRVINKVINGAGKVKILKAQEDNSPIIDYFNKVHEIIVYDEWERKISEGMGNSAMEKVMVEIRDLEQAVYLPLYNQQKLFGLIILGNKKSGDAYSVEDINVLDIISKQSAIALENARLYSEVKDFNVVLQKKVEDATWDLKLANEELQTKNEILMSLQKLTSMITKTLDPKILTQSIADGIYQELGYIGGLVIFVDPNKKWTYVDAVTRSPLIEAGLKVLPPGMTIKNLHGRFDKEERSLTLWAIESHEIKLGDKLSEMVSPTVPAPLCDQIQKIVDIKSMVAAPIYSENEVIGAIDFMLDKKKEEISRPELEIMQLLANQTGIIYRNLYLYDQVQKFNSQLRNANLQLKRLDKAKSEFISIASHQLRTPLTIIKGYMSMFLDGSFGKIDKYQAEQMEKVGESNERLINLVEDLLNISRIESDRMEYHFEEHSLGELAKSVCDELKLKADRKGLELSFKAAKKLPNIFFDNDKLRQVIMNLIDNALKYTNKGQVAIGVEKDGKSLIFSVKDTGIGIDNKDIRNLFQKFSRSKTVSVMNTEGTGLGLFVARKIVESHGGKIWAESQGEGKGSQFYISFRIGYKPEPATRQPVIDEEAEKSAEENEEKINQ